MRYKYIVAALSVLLMNITSLEAQQKIITLEEIWDRTSKHYPLIKARHASIKEKQAEKRLVNLQSLPELNIQAQQTYGSYSSATGSFFSVPGIYNSTPIPGRAGTDQRGSNLFASGVVQWDFMQFGKLKKQIALANADVDISSAELTEEIQRLQSLGSRYYMEALFRNALVSIYSKESARLEALYGLLRSRADAGLHPGADTLLIKSAFLQARSRINDQRASQTAALLQLAALINEEGSSFLPDTSLYFRINENFFFPGQDVQNHPYLEKLNTLINYSSAQLDLVKKEPLPVVSLFAGTGVRGSGIDASGNIQKNISAPWNNSSPGYLAGIGLTWNFSSLYENRTKRKIAEQQISARRSEYDHARLQLKTLYTTAVSNWQQQQLKIKDARMAYESSASAYELYTVRYESGLISLIELLQIQKNLQEAESIYVESVYALWKELLDQSESLGQPSLLLTATRK